MTGYIAGSDSANNGLLLKTTDGGAIWSPLPIGKTKWLSSVFCVGVNTVYATSDSGTIIKSTNGGATWTFLLTGTTNPLYSVYFIDSNTGYASGAFGTILKTTDAGISWVPLASETCNIINSLAFPDSTTGFAVGANGTILKTNGGINSVNEKRPVKSCFTLYPNPADNQITIKSTRHSQEETIIRISDINGKLLSRVVLQGKDFLNLDVSDLSKGMYLILIQTTSDIEIQKLIIR